MTGCAVLQGLIDGRSVAVVGNAAALLQSDLGARIDSCDCVVRMNLGLPVKAAAQGERTDVLAFSTSKVVGDRWRGFGAALHLWMSPKGRGDLRPAPSPLTFYDLEDWERLTAQLGARPSVGAMVLDILSRRNPANVSVFGYDFKRSLTFYADAVHLGPHDFAAEEQFCMTLCARKGWSFVPCQPTAAQGGAP